MLVGILSDIHGNCDALKVCLEDLHQLGVTELLLLGDFVGYYYNPSEVLHLLSSWRITAVAGNHEQMLFDAIADEQRKCDITAKYGHGIVRAIETLSAPQLEWLKSLSKMLTVEVGKLRLFLCHATPYSTDHYIYPDAAPTEFEKCRIEDHDFVFLGHSHYPFIVPGRSVCIVNPGSVGQPRDIGNSASYAVLNTENSAIVFRRRTFPIDGLLHQISVNDPGFHYLSRKLLQA